MKSKLFSLILFLIALSSFGQIKYENGYFIDNENHRTECLIKNDDWKNNPVEFDFMRAEAAIVEKANIAYVKEFGIYGFSKYIRAKIKIDRTTDDIERLTFEKNPVWSQEELFLKLLVEGRASLFIYKDGEIERFFFSVSDTVINQLVYKKYLEIVSKSRFSEEKTVVINNRFRQQLWLDLRCTNASMSSVENLNYNQHDLEKYFTHYSKCTGDSLIDHNNKSKRDWFSLKITPGFTMSTILFNHPVSIYNVAFKNNKSIRIGIETEFILPYNMNKWGIIVEPTFQYFKDEKAVYYGTASINYSSIEFPVGVRYYLFLNTNLKAFINAFYITKYVLNFNPKINSDSRTTLDINNRFSFAAGGGIEYKRVSAEIRYYTNRELLGDYMSWSTNYTRFSAIIGYKLITIKHKQR